MYSHHTTFEYSRNSENLLMNKKNAEIIYGNINPYFQTMITTILIKFIKK